MRIEQFNLRDIVNDREVEFYDNLFNDAIMPVESDSDSVAELLDNSQQLEFTNGAAFSNMFANSAIDVAELQAFFDLLKKVQKYSERRPLDLAQLSHFYDIGQDDIGGTVVPNKLLRRAGVVRTHMAPHVFFQRALSEAFMDMQTGVCE